MKRRELISVAVAFLTLTLCAFAQTPTVTSPDGYPGLRCLQDGGKLEKCAIRQK